MLPQVIPRHHLLLISLEVMLGIFLFIGYMRTEVQCPPDVLELLGSSPWDAEVPTSPPPTPPSALNSSLVIEDAQNQPSSPAGEEGRAPMPGGTNNPSPALSAKDPPVDLSNDLLIRGIHPDPEDDYFETSCKRQNRKVSVFHLWSGWTWVQTFNDPCQDWCYLTDSQDAADVVVFHAPTTALPTRRHPNQKIAAFGVEPRHFGNPKPWTNADSIDIAMTYNIDSNVPVSYMERTFWDQITSLPIPSEEEWRARGNIVWVSSNCVPERMAKMEQLMSLVHIDARGTCLNNGPKFEGSHFDLPSYYRQYKVVITFEKVWDQDYVTEKFWYLFTGGAVGVYFGPETAFFYAPAANSFIFARDFTTPQGLADKLKALTTDYQHWLHHVEWRRNLQRPRGYRRLESKAALADHTLCRLCNCACNSTCSNGARGGLGLNSRMRYLP